MASLINVHGLSKSFGSQPLFSSLACSVEDGDRLGIVGPNGSGKSTFLKILAGEILPDEGMIALKKGTKVAYVSQQSSFSADLSVTELLEKVLAEDHTPQEQQNALVSTWLGKSGFIDPHEKAGALSGGWAKRLSLACAFIREPDVLLMDEPTNHLDLEGIHWLERILKNASFTYVVVSHDRYFLDQIARRILELNAKFPGGTFSSSGNYKSFLAQKALFLEGQEQYQARLANKVRREVEWLQQGAQARSTKQQARIQSAEQLQEELTEVSRRNATKAVDFEFLSSSRKTKRLVVLENVGKTIGEKKLFQDLSLVLSPGVRIGLLGRNGSGKTSLLKILSNSEEATQGKVTFVDGLKITYFDQNREQLDLSLSLRRTLSPDSDSVVVSGRSVHVASWARRFLFNAEQLDVLVAKLSGGERARLLIAKLLLQPADVLLLDEPTNDLDIETLEVLEESLLEFPGAVVLVSHDRYFLDRVSTQILALNGSGEAIFYQDFSQWQKTAWEDKTTQERAVRDKPSVPQKNLSKKLSYMEQREYDQMEPRILEAETRLALIHEQLQDPKNAANSLLLQELTGSLNEAQNTVDTLYSRWSELESKMKV